jgi:hypothetical protein
LQQRVKNPRKHIVTYTQVGIYLTHTYTHTIPKIRNIYLLELGIVTNRMLSVEIVARVILTHLLFNGLPRWPLMPYYAVRSEEYISSPFSICLDLLSS